MQSVFSSESTRDLETIASKINEIEMQKGV